MRKFFNTVLGRGKPETEAAALDQPKQPQWQKAKPPAEIEAALTTPAVEEPLTTKKKTDPATQWQRVKPSAEVTADLATRAVEEALTSTDEHAQNVKPPVEIQADLATRGVEEPLNSPGKNPTRPIQPISLKQFKGQEEETHPLEQDERLQKMVELYLQRILIARQRGIVSVALNARNRLEQLINNHLAATTHPTETEQATRFIYELLKKQKYTTIQDDISIIVESPKISDKIRDEDIIDGKIIRLNRAIKKYGCPDEDFQRQFYKISSAEKREEPNILVNKHLDRMLAEMNTYKDALQNTQLRLFEAADRITRIIDTHLAENAATVHPTLKTSYDRTQRAIRAIAKENIINDEVNEQLSSLVAVVKRIMDKMDLQEPEQTQDVQQEGTIDYEALLEEAKQVQQEATKPTAVRSWESRDTSKAPTDDEEPGQGPEYK